VRTPGRGRPALIALLFGWLGALAWEPPAQADPWIPPGDVALRSDLLLLADAGVVTGSLTSWPLSWGAIAEDLRSAQPAELPDDARAALQRVQTQARRQMSSGEWLGHVRLAAQNEARLIRPFEALPRSDAELSAGLGWTGERFAVRLAVTQVHDPADGEATRFDGSYVGAALGNWLLTAGFQERWWGPGWDGSLILSSNARPTPQIALQRNAAEPFGVRWLRWIGPWGLTTFMGRLDDERVVDDPLLFGLRVTMRPAPDLEIGLSRTAQWCGEGRPCDAAAFFDLLVGRDNVGVNTDAEEEPGNQLAGIDVRWSSPWGERPYALYFQWIGEDTRQGGPQIGSWLRQAGVEFWGRHAGWQQRTHIEISDTVCQEGGLGFGGDKYRCAYEHGTYQTGYRYLGRVLGHGVEGDGRMYSLGTTLISERGVRWNTLLSLADINQSSSPTNTLSPTPMTLTELHLSRQQDFRFGRLRAGLGYQHLSGSTTGDDGELVGWLEFTRD
jgi:hypothetical protein